MKRMVLCLDGTWNSSYSLNKRKDGSNIIKPSNVLKLARSIKSIASLSGERKVHQIVYYAPGLGSLSQFNGRANKALSRLDLILGGIWGAGFEAQIEEAMTFLVNNFNPRDQLYMFGFSRGAATARALTHFIDWMEGIPDKEDVYFLPQLFRSYVHSKGKVSAHVIKQEIKSGIIQQNKSRKRHKIKVPFQRWQNIKINFLGVWDTVFALGSRFKHFKKDTFHVKTKTAGCVLHARQALAIDENRGDFLPAIWQAPGSGTRSLKQRWFAGVHANIGGGYVNDGLANIPFHWLKDELLSVYPDFALNQLPFKKYKKYIQDELVDSNGVWFKLKDFLSRNSGRRKIITSQLGGHHRAQLSIDFTALQRILSDPKQSSNGVLRFPDLDLYRPDNLFQYIASVGVDTFMQAYQNESEIKATELRKVRDYLSAIINPSVDEIHQ